jgi:hypothetical protein
MSVYHILLDENKNAGTVRDRTSNSNWGNTKIHQAYMSSQSGIVLFGTMNILIDQIG